MELHRTEVDGVPTLWAPTEGDLVAGLVFRVGRVDETLARGGITHLVEHLALHRIEAPDRHFNGATSPLDTTFYVRGDADEVTRFFAVICAGLRDLPLERLDIEREILRTEAGGRTRGVTEPLLTWRYGAASYGLPAFGEFGLDDLTADDLRSWAARWFTRGNAACWISGGPPPAGLRLDLPEGPRIAPPAPGTVLPRTPAYFTAGIDGIAFDAILLRSSRVSAFAAILDRRLHGLLRRELGISYNAHATVDARDAEHVAVTAFADALPAKHGKVTREFVNVLIGLATDPVTDDELAAMRRVARQSLSDPAGTTSWLAQSAGNLLLGAAVRTPNEVWERHATLTAQDIGAVGEQVLATGLAMVPTGQAVGRAGFVAAPIGSARAVDGDAFAPLGEPDTERRLVIGGDGVSLVEGLEIETVRYAECAAMLAWPDGARLLFAADAVNVRVEPQLWGLSPHVMAGLDASVPAERVVHLRPRAAGSIPRPPEPVAPPAAPAPRAAPPAPATVASRGWQRARIAAAYAFVLLVVVVVLAFIGGYTSGGIAARR